MHYAQYCRLNVHVGASNTAVIRAARKKLAAHARRSREFRTARRKFYHAMLRKHRDARKLVRQFHL